MRVKLNSLKKCLPFLLSAIVLSGCGAGTANGKASDSGGNTVKIACVGDSITQGIGADGWKNGDYTYAYPEQLGRLLGDGFTVGNFGKGSSYACYESGRTENLWYPNTFEYSQSMKFEPDIVIIMLGSNDAHNGKRSGFLQLQGSAYRNNGKISRFGKQARSLFFKQYHHGTL